MIKSGFKKYLQFSSFTSLVIFLLGIGSINSTNASSLNENKKLESSFNFRINKEASNTKMDTMLNTKQCINAEIMVYPVRNATSSVSVLTLALMNECGFSIDLSHYYITFDSKDSNGNRVMPSAFFYPRSIINPNVVPTAALNLAFIDPSNVLNGTIIGYFQNYLTPNGSWILQPGEIWVGTTNEIILPPFHEYYINDRLNGASVPLTALPGLEMSLSDTNNPPYGRDALTDIPVREHGLKLVVLTNHTFEPISQIKFPTKFPVDIIYEQKFTTCNLTGGQTLNPNESCVFTLRYTPKIEGVSEVLPILISGINGQQQVNVSVSLNINYGSRLSSHSSPGTEVNQNSKISGVTLTKADWLFPGKNSFEEITIGSSGLIGYTITNTSQVKLYAITLPKLPASGEFSYDSRTTCKLDNKLVLNHNQSCNMVIRYTPTIHHDKGMLPMQVAGVDSYDYTVYASSVLDILYSSN